MKNKMTTQDLKNYIISEAKKLHKIEVLKEEKKRIDKELKMLSENERFDATQHQEKMNFQKYNNLTSEELEPDYMFIIDIDFIYWTEDGENMGRDNYKKQIPIEASSEEEANKKGWKLVLDYEKETYGDTLEDTSINYQETFDIETFNKNF